MADKRVPELLGPLIGTNFLLFAANEKPVSKKETLHFRAAVQMHHSAALMSAHFSLCRLPTKLLLNTAHRPPPPPFPVFQTSESCRACDSAACDFSQTGRLPLTRRARSASGARLLEMGNRALQSFRPAASPHAERRCNLVHLFRYLGHLCNPSFP